MSRSRASIFVLIFALGLALRLIGIGWGLPSEIHPGELPIHPDEHVAYEESARLYDSPSLMAFVWGGAFYPRTAAIVRATFGGGGDGDEYRRTLLGLRLLNAVMALATAALVAWLATTLHGISCGLAATALFLVSPAHVLDSHYARPDVLLVLLSTVALAAAVCFARGGGARWLPIGAFAAGLATATMLSGVIGFLPLVAATWERDPTRQGLAHRLLLACLCIAGIGALGYVVGSFESFLHWDVFRAGIERAQSSHMGGHYRLPLRLLTVTAAFAFGTAALLFGYAGLALLALRRRPVGWKSVPAMCVMEAGRIPSVFRIRRSAAGEEDEQGHIFLDLDERVLGRGADVEDRAGLGRHLAVIDTQPRAPAEHVIDLVLVMGGLEVFRACGKGVDPATQRRRAQELVIGTAGIGLLSDLGLQIEGLPVLIGHAAWVSAV